MISNNLTCNSSLSQPSPYTRRMLVIKTPFKQGGSLAITIDSAIVKNLGIDQSTIFSQEVLDNDSIVLRRRKLAD
jgi:antitoxin component of MazEF toxin-antitoxin module